ncbi:MAG: gliding motility-associated transporter ATP-binding subunit GldA [Bacteroidota bacterium]|jgi:ABC-2 type transport system ATP-binding protein
MSIEAQGIVKVYGQQRALNGVSFSISSGEVIGFLGPNGAGKSTMMKIITGYIPPTEGKVKVCGFDVAEKSLDARRQIGYLPEHNPLYLDMYVREYLSFIGEMYKVDNLKKRVNDMIDRVGLGVEAHKKIEALSKGYRQRVGLAQAMIHNPQVLILDEPTSGLDPNQLVDIRALIQDIGKEKTVMLSTHIMQEVEAICSRTIIINKGNIVADQNTADLRSGGTAAGHELQVEFSGTVSRSALLSISGVADAREMGKNEWMISVASDRDIRQSIAEWAQQQGLVVLTLARKEQKLEEVFKELTAQKK